MAYSESFRTLPSQGTAVSVIHRAKYTIHVCGGIFAIPKYYDEMNLGIPQPGKDVVLTPRLIWSHFFMWDLTSSAGTPHKFDLIYTACNLFDGFRSAKLTTLRGGTGHQPVL
jgi:hypothetical protein